MVSGVLMGNALGMPIVIVGVDENALGMPMIIGGVDEECPQDAHIH